MAKMDKTEFRQKLALWVDKVVTAQADDRAGVLTETENGGYSMYHYNITKMIEDVEALLREGFDK